MLIDQLTNADSIPTLEAMVQFAGQRQKFIANNIANFDTPNYQPTDVSPVAFQEQLGEAVDRRRATFGGNRGVLEIASTREVERTPTGLKLNARPSGRNVLFHDRNDRDLERTMQDLVENVAVFRVASELLRSRVDLLRQAISERVT